MSVQIQLVETRKQLRQFIRLPFQLHRDHPRWVPPLLIEEWGYFDPKKNAAFRKNEAMLALAHKDDSVVGRIMGVINIPRNERLNEHHARFGFLECGNDPEVAAALFGCVEEWARNRGVDKIIGPMGFTEQDPEGFLVEGFEYEPTISTYYNFEFIPQLVEANGYSKELDYVVYLLDLKNDVPATYDKIGQRAIERTNCQIHEFTERKALKSYIRPVLGLMNETFVDLYGYDPLAPEEMDELAKRYLPVIDPRFVKAASKNGELIAFMLGIPNMSEGFRRAKGRLFPFGLLHLIAASKKSKQLDLLLGGIKREHRGKGLDVLGMILLIREARKAGFAVVDSHHEMETNLAVRSVMENAGGKVIKRFRIYQKPLAAAG